MYYYIVFFSIITCIPGNTSTTSNEDKKALEKNISLPTKIPHKRITQLKNSASTTFLEDTYPCTKKTSPTAPEKTSTFLPLTYVNH